MPNSAFALANTDDDKSQSYYLTCPILDSHGEYAGCEINSNFLNKIISSPAAYPNFFKSPSRLIASPYPLTTAELQILSQNVAKGTYLTRFGKNNNCWDKKAYHAEAYESFCAKKLLTNPGKVKAQCMKHASRVSASKNRSREDSGKFLGKPSHRLVRTNPNNKQNKRRRHF